MLLVPATPFADDFSEFRIPANNALLWDARLVTLAHGADFSRPGSEFSSGVLNGTVSSSFRWFSDSDPAFTSIDVGVAAVGSRAHGVRKTQVFAPAQTSLGSDESDDREMNELWSLGLSRRHYPWAVPVGFEAGVGGSGTYSQRFGSGNTDLLNVTPAASNQLTASSSSETWTYNDQVSGSVSAGWGRVRNATGIYDALVLEDRIRATGALTRPLSPAARQRLAELMYARGSYSLVRERSGRSLWAEIERTLRDDGALREGGLDPYSVLRGEEPHLGESVLLTADGVPISPVSRLRGLFLGARFVGAHQHSVARADGATSSQSIMDGTPSPPVISNVSAHSSDSHDVAEGGFVGEFHRPLSRAWQLDATAAGMAGLRAEENHLAGDTRLQVAWLAADRWTATASGRYLWFDDDRTTGPTPRDQWDLSVGMSAVYYLEDHVAIQLMGSENQRWIRGDPTGSSSPHAFARQLDASLGLTYRFAGWFQMPGFFPAASLGTP